MGGGGEVRAPQCVLQLITRTVGKARWGQDSHFFQQARETESPVLMVLQTGPETAWQVRQRTEFLCNVVKVPRSVTMPYKSMDFRTQRQVIL